MPAIFQSASQEDLFHTTIRELDRLGYSGELLELGYRFPDYFQDNLPERIVPAAAFGQSPPSYKTACFGVLLARPNGNHGCRSVELHRALGAPFQLEVQQDRVALWSVGRDSQTTRLEKEFEKSELRDAFNRHIDQWSPAALLRAKNIGFVPVPEQRDFFDLGLIPALEEQVEQKLDPILKNALAAAQRAYKSTTSSRPDERDLFRLAFRLLAGKVFHDRGVEGFATLTQEVGPDAVLRKVAEHYGETFPRILNLPTRQAAFEVIWSGLDFRNLSIDVLTVIWSKTLVTKKVRMALGIHPTPRTITSYIVNNLPAASFVGLKEAGGLIVERGIVNSCG